jgi:type II restriction enzyme
MNLNCNPALGEHHKSPSQRVKSITEGWFTAEGYCLNCTSPHLNATTPGTPFCDHICPRCAQRYELKSAQQAHTRTVQDGGYDSMMREIRAQNVPALMLLQYDPTWSVRRLLAVHPVFLTPNVVRKRERALTARPDYWMCSLDLTAIPPDGKIVVVGEGKARPMAETRKAFQNSKRFEDIPLAKRGWPALVLSLVRKSGKEYFTIDDIMRFEEQMHAAYPENSHKREKVRQQLQVLMALEYIDRVSPSEFKVLL